jgi:transcriptional regulator GlxA family with amidase domain
MTPLNRIHRLIFAMIILGACGTPGSRQIDTGPPILPGKELNAAFLIVNGVYNSELMAPMDVFQHTIFHTDKGIRTFTVASSRDTIITFEGLKIIPDYSYAKDSLPDIDILVVPSAKHSMDTDLNDQQLVEFVASTGRHAAFVLSLCDGAFVLAKAGLLDLHECTTFPDDVDKLRQAFPQLKVHEKVSFVKDRHMITSAGGARSYEAALFLTQLLYGKEVAEAIAHGLVIDWNVSAVPAVVTSR